jgi:hypothetical protein
MDNMHRRFASLRRKAIRPDRSPGTKRRTPSTDNLPDPSKHTTAKCWTRKDGTFGISTKTDGNHDGTALFALNEDGTPTYQIQLMRLLCHHYPSPVALKEIITQVYPEYYQSVLAGSLKLTTVLKRLRGMVSDIRTKKLEPAGINPDILPPLSVEATLDIGYSLQVAMLHKMDDISLDKFDDPDFA